MHFWNPNPELLVNCGLECNRSSGFGFQKCFSQNFQLHCRDPTLDTCRVYSGTQQSQSITSCNCKMILSRDWCIMWFNSEWIVTWPWNGFWTKMMFGSRSLAECLANSKTYRSASRSLKNLEFLPLKSHYRFSSSLLIIWFYLFTISVLGL